MQGKLNSSVLMCTITLIDLHTDTLVTLLLIECEFHV